jgi:hypothetical protein
MDSSLTREQAELLRRDLRLKYKRNLWLLVRATNQARTESLNNASRGMLFAAGVHVIARVIEEQAKVLSALTFYIQGDGFLILPEEAKKWKMN